MTQRQYSNQWNDCIASHTDPKISSAKIRSKICRLDFLVSRQHPIDYLPKSHTISTDNYLSRPIQLKDILREICGGMFTKLDLFVHDNASAHRALASHKKLAFLGFHCLHHPPYSPDLAPSVYHLFT